MCELPGVRTPTQKQSAFLQALCLSHSVKGLLLSARVLCDFREGLSFTAWNASDLYLSSEVMQSWGNMLLPATCLQQEYSWTRLAWRMDPCAPEPITIWKSRCEGLQSEAMLGQRVSSQPCLSIVARTFFPLYRYFASFFDLWIFFTLWFPREKKNAMRNLLKLFVHALKKKGHYKLNSNSS